MNVKELCEKAGITRRYWNYLLTAQRQAGPDTAKTLARILSVDKSLFVFGTAKQRQAAWKKAAKAGEKIGVAKKLSKASAKK
jgi:hypothetical protein